MTGLSTWVCTPCQHEFTLCSIGSLSIVQRGWRSPYMNLYTRDLSPITVVVPTTLSGDLVIGSLAPRFLCITAGTIVAGADSACSLDRSRWHWGRWLPPNCTLWSWVISHVPMFHITQPLGDYGLLDGYFFRWCPIFPSHGTFTNPWNGPIQTEANDGAEPLEGVSGKKKPFAANLCERRHPIPLLAEWSSVKFTTCRVWCPKQHLLEIVHYIFFHRCYPPHQYFNPNDGDLPGLMLCAARLWLWTLTAAWHLLKVRRGLATLLRSWSWTIQSEFLLVILVWDGYLRNYIYPISISYYLSICIYTIIYTISNIIYMCIYNHIWYIYIYLYTYT